MMDEINELELKRLKCRQELLGRELADIANAISRLEKRLEEQASHDEAKENLPSQLLQAQQATPSKDTRELARPAEIPPVIPTQIAPQIPHATVTPEKSPTEAPAEFAPIFATAQSQEALPEPVGSASAKAKSESTPPPLPSGVSSRPSDLKPSFEMRLGTYWLVRIGAVLILTGLVFFGNLAYQKMGAGGKVALLYLASSLLLGAGAWWQRRSVKESLQNYAQVLFAGGLAAVYFTTYAAHHVETLQVIRSALVDGVLLFGWAAFIAWIADRRKSELLALFATGLAYYASVITPVGRFTLYSNLVLTVAAIVFLLRNRWAALSWASMVATYASYGWWRFFHGGEGPHWPTTDQGLWFGASFLCGYWLVFTLAVFLSKHDSLRGQRRAAFLTFNNGALFALFVLTMWQVESVRFWQFSLIFGGVLLVLAECTRRFLPAEPITRNTYLTQGLLLVTVGFVSKYTGMQLALILAAECVILFILGTLRRNIFLQTGAYISGAMAVSWGVDGLERFDNHGLWLGTTIGAMMLLNALWAHWRMVWADKKAVRPVPAYFTILALAIWFLTTWQNAAAEQIGLILAIESLAFILSIFILRLRELPLLGQGYLMLAQVAWFYPVSTATSQFTGIVLGATSVVLLITCWRYGLRALQFGAVFGAMMATAWAIAGMERFQMSGLVSGLAVAALMILNAFLTHKKDRELKADPLRPGPVYFSALSVLLAIAVTWHNTNEQNLPLWLLAEALLFTVSIYTLRIRELALLGQSLVIVGHFVWQLNLARLGSPPWWNPILMVVMSLVLTHWWQRQKVLSAITRVSLAFQLALSLCFALMLGAWLDKDLIASNWLMMSAALAVGVTAYAAATRVWMLAACAQLFLLPTGWLFFEQLSQGGGPKFAALAPIAALALLSAATVTWFSRRPDASSTLSDPLLKLAMLYRWMALAMSLWWVTEYISQRERVWVLTLLGLAGFLFAGWRRSREAICYGAVFTLAGLVIQWLTPTREQLVYAPNFLALLVLLVQQQIVRRRPDRYALPEGIHYAVIVIGGLSLWRFVSEWVLLGASGFYLTASWSLLALVLFGCGILLRERMYRWVGLGLLAAALGRVVIFDVWKLQTFYRVLSFMALGVALVVLGFIYNKYQERLRQWL